MGCVLTARGGRPHTKAGGTEPCEVRPGSGFAGSGSYWHGCNSSEVAPNKGRNPGTLFIFLVHSTLPANQPFWTLQRLHMYQDLQSNNSVTYIAVIKCLRSCYLATQMQHPLKLCLHANTVCCGFTAAPPLSGVMVKGVLPWQAACSVPGTGDHWVCW